MLTLKINAGLILIDSPINIFWCASRIWFP